MVARVSRPAIAWQRVGASGLMFLNAPGVKWAGGVGAPVVTAGALEVRQAVETWQGDVDPCRPLPFLQAPTP